MESSQSIMPKEQRVELLFNCLDLRHSGLREQTDVRTKRVGLLFNCLGLRHNGLKHSCKGAWVWDQRVMRPRPLNLRHRFLELSKHDLDGLLFSDMILHVFDKGRLGDSAWVGLHGWNKRY